MDDEHFMRAALQEAEKAYALGEVPIGAVVVYENQIISRAYNQVEFLKDASAHAEFLCLRQAAEHLSNWRLLGCTLYCTLEPCLMCAGAMILSRLPTLVFGAPDLRHGACGSLMNVFTTHPIHRPTIRSAVLEHESSTLLKKFFQERRACKTPSIN